MMNKLKHYIPLLGLFILGVIGFWLFPQNKTIQVILASAIALGYIFWGTIHHVIHKDISTEVLIEYFLIAIIGMTLMLSIILRS